MGAPLNRNETIYRIGLIKTKFCLYNCFISFFFICPACLECSQCLSVFLTIFSLQPKFNVCIQSLLGLLKEISGSFQLPKRLV